ncbi:hypothetical protein BH10BAC3_BH10BAC3_17960 [soil metagenome]
MNQHFFNIRNITKQLFLGGLIIFLALPVFTKNKQKNVEPVSTNQPALQVVTSDESSTLLSLQYETEVPVKFDVIIRDEAGNLLYRKSYESSRFLKQFKLVNETGGNNAPVSVAIQLAGGIQFNYTVNSMVAVVKEVHINKV